ncbi:D-amino acid oxidase 2 [Arctopsyche grandis]|uniref:D-amino acid oxidase 2 n=1 Tax=Arctopsyche grandis TaxID=121162 RepID=UPI00406D652F
MKKVLIIGAGVSGLGSAIRIKEKFPDFKVTIATKDITPNTTGDGSAGLWGPFILGSTPDDKVVQWSRETHDFFLYLWREGLAGSCLIPCLRVDKTKNPLPSWKHVVFGFKELNEVELEVWKSIYSMDDIQSAFSFVTFTCEPKHLLKYLMDRFYKLGGKIVQREIKSIDNLSDEDYDIIINCSGLGAKYIVPDPKVIPVRGQVARVKAPWIYHVLLDESDDGNYIIPNTDTVVLGGTHQENDFNTNICKEDSKFIRQGCEHIVPGLKNIETLFEWVGLRPGRDSVRLESGSMRNNKSKLIIHNYGHGGSGVTLFWGCAREVVDILTSALDETSKSKL